MVKVSTKRGKGIYTYNCCKKVRLTLSELYVITTALEEYKFVCFNGEKFNRWKPIKDKWMERYHKRMDRFDFDGDVYEPGKVYQFMFMSIDEIEIIIDALKLNAIADCQVTFEYPMRKKVSLCYHEGYTTCLIEGKCKWWSINEELGCQICVPIIAARLRERLRKVKCKLEKEIKEYGGEKGKTGTNVGKEKTEGDVRSGIRNKRE